MDNTIYWIWLQLALGPASSVHQVLLSHYDSDIKRVYEAEISELKELKITPKTQKALIDKSTEQAQEIIDWCKQKKVSILCYDDPLYPKRLRSIPDSPLVLYYIGELYDIDNMLCMACVGTRYMTRYGHDTAYAFCYDLARSGAIVVSGLASGIDTTGHRAALDAGGKTVAVLGTNISKVYPAENRDIMREIARKGLLITEYHPFHDTRPANFPQRNRIISGLSQGTIVFEADARSGSLITARRACKQGRKVYALPGKVGEAGALGTNELIREGATLVTRANDIIEEFIYLYDLKVTEKRVFDYSPTTPNNDSYKKKPSKKEKQLDIGDELQKKVYSMLNSDTPVSIEQLIIPGYDFGDIMSALTMLELYGLVKQHPGNTYTKKH